MNGLSATLRKQWDELRDNYWFIPTVMSLGAIALAAATSAADQWATAALGGGQPPFAFIHWLYVNDPQGARNFLSTIANSFIGVAGVTFSITIASVAYTASNFGPRLLTNFLGDRGNQVSLGTFIATFLYCMLILRVVSASAGETQAVIPHISILVALLLAIASVVVLIYFLNHIPQSIHISNLVADIGNDLCRMIETEFPEAGEGVAEPEAPRLPDGFVADAELIESRHDGYLRNVAYSALVDMAREHDLLLRLEPHVGEFIHSGQLLVLAAPADRVTPKVASQIREAFAYGKQRTQSQDPMFLINELVEIATRALSPAVNDPFTACSCVNWLRSALTRIARRDMPVPELRDENDALRVALPPVSFEHYATGGFGRLRHYFMADPNATCHMLRAMTDIAPLLRLENQRRTISRLAETLRKAAIITIDDPASQARIERHIEVLREAMDSGAETHQPVERPLNA